MNTTTRSAETAACPAATQPSTAHLIEDSPRLLLHGIDTVQCAYALRKRGPGRINFASLLAQREALRNAKTREPGAVKIGSLEFFLAPHGSPQGFPLILTNEDYRIEFGEYINPPFFVTFKSQALWRESAALLHRKFLDWAASVGYVPFDDEGLSRVDFCFDYHLPQIDFDEDCFVSLSSKDSQHRQEGRVQTFTFGRSDAVLRVYDKVAEIQQQSDKVWFYQLWKRDSEVWRIEWQIRKPLLRRFDIRTFQDLQDQQGDLLRYLAEEHDTLRVRTRDSNRSRWRLHPLWSDLQAKIRTLESLGIYKVNGKPAVLSERKIRLAVSMYGYLKRLAAVHATQTHAEHVRLDAAVSELQRLIGKVHDPLTWNLDVAKRIKAIELGEW